MRRVLVTGGAGFIGSHLCASLVAAGEDVFCVDNLYTGHLANIKGLLGLPNFRFIQQDIQLPLSLEVDEIYNLACPASPSQYQRDAVYTTKTIVLGALSILELATRTQARVLQASTSEIYGEPKLHPQPESYWGRVNPIGIRSCYDEGKRCAETLFFDFRRQYHTDIKVVRIFNTYGKNMDPDDGRVVSNFIMQALHNQDITIYGTGRQTRSFCYIDDLIEGLIRMMRSRPDFVGPLNLGNPSEVTIEELAHLIIELTGSKSRLVNRSLPQDDPTQRQPVIDLAMAELGWQPTIGLREGLARTISYFR